ncbi:MAG: hypothetical protein EXS35_16210, partial [Pedosphaera sp.]|nr:hypothetical protein [Pedosphaera sp.]
AGGTLVTITGSNFVSGLNVLFGSSNATSVNFSNSTLITAVSPAHAAGLVDVTVVNPDSQSAIATNAFTFVPPPTITSITPASCPDSGGAFVTITGSNFVTGLNVSFGSSNAASVNFSNSTLITAISPAHAASLVDVTVVNPDLQSAIATNAFTFIAAPFITSVAPASGPDAGGTLVTITGSNFVSGLNVLFGASNAASVNFSNSTLITAISPAHAAGVVDVTVVNPDSQSAVATNAFTFVPPPTITSITPASCPDSGGAFVTITGSNFVSGLSVLFGASNATTVNFSNATLVTVFAPAHPPATVHLTVVNPDGQSAVASNAFTFVGPPLITGVTPASGPTAGGTLITITGSNFVDGLSVFIGGSGADSVNFSNATLVTAVTPAHAPGLVDVTVINPDYQTAVAPNAFTFLAPPSIISVAPTNGPVAGGTLVTITGSNFVSGLTVTFGSSNAASVNFSNSTLITAVSPAHAAGVVDITVVNPDLQSALATNAFTFIAPPLVTSVTPTNGPDAGGTLVTIAGSNFVSGLTVTFGSSNAASVNFSNSTLITAVSPAHAAGVVDVTVQNPDSQTATATNAFTFEAPPPPAPFVITSIVPLTDTAFIVTWNSVSNQLYSVQFKSTVDAANWLTLATVTATGVSTSYTNTGLAGIAQRFYRVVQVSASAPMIIAINPTNGPTAGGTAVTVTGSNFVAGALVIFGGELSPSVTVSNDTTLVAISPAHSAGSFNVTVQNPDSQSTTATNAFTFVAPPPPAPTITDISPVSGPNAGGTFVTITGSNFVSGLTVSFGSSNATSVNFSNTTLITAVTPAHTAGGVDVTVTNPDSQSTTATNAFTFVAPPPPAPVITDITPASGPDAGGTLVTITGSNFVSGLTVSFGTSNATSVNFSNSTFITAVSPAHAAGVVDVTVLNPDSQSAVATNAFAFLASLENFSIISIALLDPDSVEIVWNAASNAVYEVQMRDDLFATNWASLGMVTGATTSASFTNTGVATNAQRFYRVGRLP